MKKTTSIAFLLCIVLAMMFLTACNNSDITSSPSPSTVNDPNNQNTDKKDIYTTSNDIIKSILKIDVEPRDEGEYKNKNTTYKYNKDRQLVKVTFLFLISTSTYTVSYNNEGKISTIDISGSITKDKINFEYDSAGKMTKLINSKDGKEVEYYDITYNENEKTVTLNSSANLCTIMNYNEGWMLTRAEIFNADGKRESCSTYEYDENGNLTKLSDYDADGKLKDYGFYEYDENGNCTKNSYYFYDDYGTLIS